MKLNINKIVEKLNKNLNINIITIDGITCSGKSVFSKLLKKKIGKIFKNVLVLPKDLFLFSRERRIKIIKKINKNTNHKGNYLQYDLNKLNKLIDVLIGKSKNKSITLSNLYDRKTGKNHKIVNFKFKKNTLIIFEGLYVLDDLKGKIKPNFKILITENIYESLARKIERIRDKKISIQLVVTEYTELHLRSFKNYLDRNTFNYSYTDFKRNFTLIKNGKQKQIDLINKFKIKHY